MKLLELDIDGFRSLKSVRWNPGNLNVIIGPNGAGKSNLLRALEFLSVAVQGGLNRYVLASGGMGSIVWDGQSPTITFRVVTTRPEAHESLYSQNLAYDILLERVGQTSGYIIDRELLGNYPRIWDPSSSVPFALIQRAPANNAVLYNNNQAGVPVQPTYLDSTETVLSKLTGIGSARELTAPYRDYFSKIRIYHDMPVHRGASIREAPVVRWEREVAPDGQNLVNVLHTLYTEDSDWREELDAAMRAAFGQEFMELQFPPAADQRIELRIHWKSLKRTQPASDLSDGTLRFLLLLTILSNSEGATVIAIDEPETGLHPSMLPIIAEYAEQASDPAQVIITTHSPQFLSAFRDTIPITTVAAWENGETSLKILTGADLSQWLKDFSLGNLFASGELEAMV